MDTRVDRLSACGPFHSEACVHRGARPDVVACCQEGAQDTVVMGVLFPDFLAELVGLQVWQQVEEMAELSLAVRVQLVAALLAVMYRLLLQAPPRLALRASVLIRLV